MGMQLCAKEKRYMKSVSYTSRKTVGKYVSQTLSADWVFQWRMQKYERGVSKRESKSMLITIHDIFIRAYTDCTADLWSTSLTGHWRRITNVEAESLSITH